MPQLSRHHCTRCERSIYNVIIDGQRVPLVAQLTFGQPADTGPALDVNGPGVRLPSAVREIMQTAVPRLELCMECFADVFGLPLLTAHEDPVYDANFDGIPDATQIDLTLPQVEQFRMMHARTLEAIRFGRGAPDALMPVPKPRELSAEERAAALEQENAELRAQLEAQPSTTPTDPATPPAADSL